MAYDLHSIEPDQDLRYDNRPSYFKMRDNSLLKIYSETYFKKLKKFPDEAVLFRLELSANLNIYKETHWERSFWEIPKNKPKKIESYIQFVDKMYNCWRSVIDWYSWYEYKKYFLGGTLWDKLKTETGKKDAEIKERVYGKHFLTEQKVINIFKMSAKQMFMPTWLIPEDIKKIEGFWGGGDWKKDKKICSFNRKNHEEWRNIKVFDILFCRFFDNVVEKKMLGDDI
ncbi:MAG: hypothetical protein ABIG20_03280 [archaeon]